MSKTHKSKAQMIGDIMAFSKANGCRISDDALISLLFMTEGSIRKMMKRLNISIFI